jgi:hypothetical protein
MSVTPPTDEAGTWDVMRTGIDQARKPARVLLLAAQSFTAPWQAEFAEHVNDAINSLNAAVAVVPEEI